VATQAGDHARHPNDRPHCAEEHLALLPDAQIDWLENRDFSREELRGLLSGTLLGALQAAGLPPSL
jgi:hypothetical protein